jgi:amino acid adenylation domain-containing protein
MNIAAIQGTRGSLSPGSNENLATPTLVALFEQQTQRTPAATALQYGSEKLSYLELNHKVNQLASHLRALGASAGVLVGISLPRSMDMVIAVLAVLKSGAAYVPLDPQYPANRLSFMLEDAGCPLLIGLEKTHTDLAFQGQLVALDTQSGTIFSGTGIANVQPACRADDLAYIIYTSGSTGKPKGVEIEHQAVVNLILALQAAFQIQVGSVFLSVVSLSFDMSVLDMFLPLSSGACLVVAAREDTINPERLLNAIAHHGATVLQATPATWKMLLDAGLPERRSLSALIGGDALPQDLAEALEERLGSVWNLYGPTEAAVYTSIARYLGGKPLIGKALVNTEILILNAAGQPVPSGQAGELHIAGVCLARGYRNRPELTADKFIPHPWAAVSGARLYKTGDLARMTNSGDIECLGRIDRQVKIRGHRIELGEIEALLRKCVGVRDVAVIDVLDSSAQKSLVAYYVETDQGAKPAQLRNQLRLQLPSFMVPAKFIALAGLPLTPNNKVDVQALRVKDAELHAQAQALEDSDIEVESGAVQDQVKALWCQALRCQEIDPDDNFFDLGGHSLMAVSLTMRLEEKFGTVIPLDALWSEGNTVAGMAALIGSLRGHTLSVEERSRLVPLKPGGRKPPLFVIHTMRGSVNEYQALASHLPEDQPVIGVRSKGLYGDAPPAPQIRQFAIDCVQAIREHCPHGPYQIAGFSVGGLIAYEVALILSAAQEEIAFLGLFDTPAPGFIYTTPLREQVKQKWAGAGRRAKRLLAPMRQLLSGENMDHVAGLGGTDPSRISQHAMALFQSLKLAEYSYQVSGACPVPIELFMAQSASWSEPSQALGWRPFAKAGIACHHMAAQSHEDLMAPHHAPELARWVKSRLPSCASVNPLG